MRSFDDRPIADDHLDQILEAGRRTPSSQNWQPWDFILIRQRAQLLELARLGRRLLDALVSTAKVDAEPLARFLLGQPRS